MFNDFIPASSMHSPNRRLEIRRALPPLDLRRTLHGRRRWDVDAFLHSINAQRALQKEVSYPSTLHLSRLFWVLVITGTATAILFMRGHPRVPRCGDFAVYTWSGFHRVSGK